MSEQLKTLVSTLSFLDPQGQLIELWERLKGASLSTQIALVAAAIVTVTSFPSWYRQIARRLVLGGKRKAVRAARERALDSLRQSLPNDQVTCEKSKTISQLSLEELMEQLRGGQLNPVEVLQAYQRQALESQQKTNCLVGPIEEAKEWACNLKPNAGMLYGIPVALKDDQSVKGYDSILGCSEYIGKPCEQDCVIVKILKKHGAIPFMKTNVPQTLVSLETSNPVFGTTTNAHDNTLSPGGSSGGAAAIVASGGAILAMGGDLAGSIRCPAAFNGICGFKPTAGRMSLRGMTGPVKGVSCLVQPSIGPLSRDVAGCVLMMKAMWSGYMWELDPTVPPVPFAHQVYEDTRPLRIGYFVNNGIMPAAPACERSVMVAKQALEKAGHQVVPFNPPDLSELPSYFSHSVIGDQGKAFVDVIRYDAIDWTAIGPVSAVVMAPIWLKKLVAFLLRPVSPHMSRVLRDACGFSTVHEWWLINDKMRNDRAVFYQYWKRQKLDAVICPSYATHAIELGHSEVLLDAASYTVIFNTLNCPAGVVPVTKVTAEDERDALDYPATSRVQSIAKACMQKSAGLPVCVQCATLPWQDELCLRVMNEIEANILL